MLRCAADNASQYRTGGLRHQDNQKDNGCNDKDYLQNERVFQQASGLSLFPEFYPLPYLTCAGLDVPGRLEFLSGCLQADFITLLQVFFGPDLCFAQQPPAAA